MKPEKNVAPENQVFVNRTLNLNAIKVVGFDMDYTIVTYNVPAFEAKAFELVTNKLVSERGYPREIFTRDFDPEFIIRGLVIDSAMGNILKVNRYGYVKKASHGTTFLSVEDQKKIYSTRGIDLTDSRYYIIHTLFSLAEGSLFAQMVDYYESSRIPVNFPKIFSDIRNCLDEAHQEGSLKGFITQHPQDFILKDPKIVMALKRLKEYGKKVVMITNSDYEFSKLVMDFSFSEFLDQPWQDFFDLVIVGAGKPGFFQQQLKFLKVDRESGFLSNFHEPIKYGQIYQGGNARTFERNLGLSPSEILYCGDHIWGDVVTLKEAIGWRTGLVVQELRKEVPSLLKNQEIQRGIAAAMETKEELENAFYEVKEDLWNTPHRKRDPKIEKKRDALREKIARLDEEITELINRDQCEFNKYWGEVMRAGNEESRFATLVERYACIYMSSVGNLSYYSPFKYFRPPRRYLAHDPIPFGNRDLPEPLEKGQ